MVEATRASLVLARHKDWGPSFRNYSQPRSNSTRRSQNDYSPIPLSRRLRLTPSLQTMASPLAFYPPPQFYVTPSTRPPANFPLNSNYKMKPGKSKMKKMSSS
ncbi:hypothetical protein K1719_015115 [Acacia pycnantha]|nr:hypothetical protein K1719_015115 [Acacia pycnantha]